MFLDAAAGKIGGLPTKWDAMGGRQRSRHTPCAVRPLCDESLQRRVFRVRYYREYFLRATASEDWAEMFLDAAAGKIGGLPTKWDAMGGRQRSRHTPCAVRPLCDESLQRRVFCVRYYREYFLRAAASEDWAEMFLDAAAGKIGGLPTKWDAMGERQRSRHTPCAVRPLCDESLQRRVFCVRYYHEYFLRAAASEDWAEMFWTPLPARSEAFRRNGTQWANGNVAGTLRVPSAHCATSLCNGGCSA